MLTIENNSVRSVVKFNACISVLNLSVGQPHSTPSAGLTFKMKVCSQVWAKKGPICASLVLFYAILVSGELTGRKSHSFPFTVFSSAHTYSLAYRHPTSLFDAEWQNRFLGSAFLETWSCFYSSGMFHRFAPYLFFLLVIIDFFLLISGGVAFGDSVWHFTSRADFCSSCLHLLARLEWKLGLEIAVILCFQSMLGRSYRL